MDRSLEQHSSEVEAKWSLVEQVAAATALQRSARLRMLLLHVGRHSIFEQGAPLREVEIGNVVFGRSAQYDTSQDNIVRVNFSELRKRIHQYFRTEGRHQGVQFDIPRGSYELRFFDKPLDAFEQVAAELQQEPTSPEDALSAPADKPGEEDVTLPVPAAWRTLGRVKTLLLTCYTLFFLLLFSIAAACWFWLRASASEKELEGWRAGPALRVFWQPFLSGPEPVDIVLADSSLAMAQDLTGHDLSLSDYISYNYQPLYDAEKAEHRTPGAARLLLSRNTGSAGDFKVAALVQALAPTTMSKIIFARAYSAASARDHNSILLGSRRSNPWVELLEQRLQYRFHTSADRHETTIEVLHPRPGEPAEYVSISDPSTKTGYAVIAVLPNPGGTGHTLLIAGTDSRATLAAGEFIINEKKLEGLDRELGGHSLDQVQLLLRSETIRDTPISSQVISYRRNTLD